MSYRDDGGIVNGRQKELNSKKYVLGWSCIQDEQSSPFFFFMKLLGIPLYLPSALPDHIKLDLPDEVFEKINTKLFN